MADQQIRRRRPKRKGKKDQASLRNSGSSSRGPSSAQLGVLQSSPHLRCPPRPHCQVLPEDLEGRVFLRFTNRDEIHNGYQWRTGLNTDPLRFSHKDACGPGGLYFCEMAEMPVWHSWRGSTWVREVTPILQGEKPQVVRLPNKWKAHEVQAGERRCLGDYATWVWLLQVADGSCQSVVNRSAVSSCLRNSVGTRMSRNGAKTVRDLVHSMIDYYGGSLQDVLKALGREKDWSPYELHCLAEAAKPMVGCKDWRACRRVYSHLELSRISAAQVARQIFRAVVSIVKPTGGLE